MMVNALGSSSRSTQTATNELRQCVFCREEIRPGASVCPHCGGTLTPLQGFADKQAALEQRLAALEQEVAALRAGGLEQAAVEGDPAPAAAPSPSVRAEFKWPHMADNIFLGLMTLLAAHWLATTLPTSERTVYRLVALAVALPFGFRFERNSRSGPSGQVLAALAFGSIGTLAIGLLDIAVAGRGAPPPTPQDIIASVAAIALSHFAGSALAHSRRMRAEQADRAAVDAVSAGGNAAKSLLHIEPARIKGTAEAVKALYDAAAPLAAGAGALWAAFGHSLF
ncbi:MAG TPA: zinc ribbon domain-containing protein [Acetobacteraceae bacterium]|nr:zinc ribbon domain-containing protein [Acetobacteraceae bacterium]